MDHLKDLHVLILGMGSSGLAMARWCASHGARLTVADTRMQPPCLDELRCDVPSTQFKHVADRARPAGDARPEIANYTTVDLLLRTRGITHLDLPMTPQRVWTALQQRPS